MCKTLTAKEKVVVDNESSTDRQADMLRGEHGEGKRSFMNWLNLVTEKKCSIVN
jgi:hypothetical protein